MQRTPYAIVLGCAEQVLQPEEAQLLRDYPPMGVILFRRNIENPTQLRQLIADLKTAAGWDMPIWIDQEGGRVQRLAPPHWRGFPTMEKYAQAYGQDSAHGEALLRAGTALLAQELRDMGIAVDCHPVLDLRFPNAHDIIGDRAFGDQPTLVVHLASMVIDQLSAHGIVPVMKHFPGHGRALCDSHEALPVVDVPFAALLAHDLAPFLALKHTPMVMTAHIRYPQWDAAYPATLSRTILHDWWRTEMGYDGLIVSDDLAMHALQGMGSLPELAQASIAAGADMALYCTGKHAENLPLVQHTPRMTDQAWIRWQRCAQITNRPAIPPSPQAEDLYQRWWDEAR